MSDNVLRAQGRFFVQDDESVPFWLMTCTGVGDVTIPFGDETPVYCPSPSEIGKFVITDVITGEAGLITYSIVRPLQKVVNYILEELTDCRWHGRVNWSATGAVPDVFTTYYLGLHLHFSRATTATVGQPAILAPDEEERVETNADISSWSWVLVYPLAATRIALTEDSAINGLAFDLSSACYDDEAGGDKIAKEGYFGTDHTSTSPAVNADVWYTTDYGVTWTLCAADPFGAAEDVGPVETRGGRVFVGRITADGGPAEIAYSDDYGTTWSNVILGALNNQVVNAITILDMSNIWAACSSGYVYYCEDRGDTWVAQTAGTVTAQHLRDINAYDVNNVWAVGETAALIATTDGENWAIVAPPTGIVADMNTVYMRNATRVFIGSDDGVLYRTTEGDEAVAANWTTFATPTWAAGSVRRIRGDQDLRYYLFVAGNLASTVGEVFRSEDGGASFQQVAVPLNDGLNDLEVIDANTCWVGGEPNAGTAYLLKIHKTS